MDAYHVPCRPSASVISLGGLRLSRHTTLLCFRSDAMQPSRENYRLPVEQQACSMKTLYIDNSVLGREQDWSSITALHKIMLELRVVISDWHMVELAGGSDRAQAFMRADFVDSLKPLWMRGYLPIQKLEVKRFTWRQYFHVPAEEYSVFTNYLSEVWADYLGSQTPIGLNARK